MMKCKLSGSEQIEQSRLGGLIWLRRELTDRKARGSNPIPANRLFGQPDSISTFEHPLGSMAHGHRKGATAKRLITVNYQTSR
ncbi:hypothetical protein T265_10191 [Opisthorchis viverrini]|uniref:Uncharacterized protein n=1 Tax=Opisthorchis viverrini TaxID=6198 RepID=A0A074Z7E4_OPIVI|nr:hypothetical protein T265_10191 [Opisthorchis viverrini]KER21502.1 hypothetical protein T265_10191 [Opisthorchis viverrini]